MPASTKLISTPLLSLLLMVALCAAPVAQAKKDLFANDPANQQSAATQQLRSTSDAANITPENQAPASATESAVPDTVPAPAEKSAPSGLEKQWERLKKNLNKTKKDLFGGEPKASDKARPATALMQEQEQAQESSSDTGSSSSSQDTRPQISATDAAQRAQRTTEGQVMNVRKVQDDDKTLYNVNLLQKNGRMKTVNIDAHSGDVVEEPAQ